MGAGVGLRDGRRQVAEGAGGGVAVAGPGGRAVCGLGGWGFDNSAVVDSEGPSAEP